MEDIYEGYRRVVLRENAGPPQEYWVKRYAAPQKWICPSEKCHHMNLACWNDCILCGTDRDDA
tara:strand:+ start:585 stop:773 length:189 start_codon:yes stop_codon:yes gene_type:complete